MTLAEAQHWEHRGLQAFEAGRWEEAEHAFARAAHLYSHLNRPVDVARMQGNQGVILLEQGRVEEALRLLEPLPNTLAALQAHYEAALAWGNLALTLERAGRVREAEAAYYRALEGLTGPEERAAVYRGLARLAWRRLHFRKALESMSQAVLLAPRSLLESLVGWVLRLLFQASGS